MKQQLAELKQLGFWKAKVLQLEAEVARLKEQMKSETRQEALRGHSRPASAMRAKKLPRPVSAPTMTELPAVSSRYECDQKEDGQEGAPRPASKLDHRDAHGEREAQVEHLNAKLGEQQQRINFLATRLALARVRDSASSGVFLPHDAYKTNPAPGSF